VINVASSYFVTDYCELGLLYKSRKYWVIIRMWADKICLNCNIFDYIRHTWIKKVVCNRMVSLFHHTSTCTHRRLQSSISAHRNGRVSDLPFKQTAVIELLTAGKVPSIEIHRRKQVVCGDQCVDVSAVRRWIR